MARGGYREGAGRPFGARDAAPRKNARLDRLKSMSQEYDTNEYLITNNERVFGGTALELMTALYKAEQLPVRVRLYAPSKAVEFESDKRPLSMSPELTATPLRDRGDTPPGSMSMWRKQKD
jgi:hypothetical protein